MSTPTDETRGQFDLGHPPRHSNYEGSGEPPRYRFGPAEAFSNLGDELENASRALTETIERLDKAERDLLKVLTSTSWRASAVPRYLTDIVKFALRRTPTRPSFQRVRPARTTAGHRAYARWISYFDNVDLARTKILTRLQQLTDRPLFSIVVPVFNPPADYLESAIESVREQLYDDWELCLADDASTDPLVFDILNRYERMDERIKVIRRQKNGHISTASNSALDLASGGWVAFLDHDDVLAPHALALMALAIGDHPAADVLYSDEDKIDSELGRHSPYFKPDFDPLLLLGQNYLTHFLVIRRSLVSQVGGMRVGFEGAQDWDLALRATEQVSPENVVHVPHVLYHWRSHGGSAASSINAKDYAQAAGTRAVEDHLRRTGNSAQVTTISASGHLNVRWTLPDDVPRVSIIIPTKDGSYLEGCVESLLSSTRYANFEIVVVDNGSQQEQTLEYLASIKQRGCLVARDARPFNFSALNNQAARTATGDLFCLLNDDTEIISGDWLDEMVGHILRPDVGAVGAKLYYDDGRIQHAGVVLGIGGVAGHGYRTWPRDSFGYMGRLLLAQRMSAVTAACMLVRREAWQQVEGFDETLAVAFNDVDFCLRLREAGWQIVWTPCAELIHHESVSRGSEEARATEFTTEVTYMKQRWAHQLRYDPAYNPNLTLVHEDWSLAWPPRVSYGANP